MEIVISTLATIVATRLSCGHEYVDSVRLSLHDPYQMDFSEAFR